MRLNFLQPKVLRIAIIVSNPDLRKVSGTMVNLRFLWADFAKLTQATLQFWPSLPKQEMSLRQTRFNRLGCKSNNFVAERSGEPAGSPPRRV